jgi:tetratricopeptide (TPR) repeat protein
LEPSSVIDDDKRAELLTLSLKAVGHLYLKLGNIDDAVAALEECLAIMRVRKRTPVHQIKNVLVELSSIYFERDDFDAVTLLLEEALQLQLESGDDVALSLNNLGLAQERNGDLARALVYYQRLLQLRRQRSDDILTAESMVTCAKILERTQRSHDALVLYKEALAIYRQHPEAHMALIAELVVRTSKTPSLYADAISDSDETESLETKARSLYEMARSHREQKSHQAAKDCLLKCRQLMQTAMRGDLRIRVDALEQMLQNDEAIIAVDDDTTAYESFHRAPSQELAACISSESATQFVMPLVFDDDNDDCPKMHTILLEVEDEGVEMEHVPPPPPPPPPTRPRVKPTETILQDDDSVVSEMTELTDAFGGRLGISQRPDTVEVRAAMEAQSRMLSPWNSPATMDEAPSTTPVSLAKAVAQQISDPPDPELSLDMLATLEDSDSDDEVIEHTQRTQTTKWSMPTVLSAVAEEHCSVTETDNSGDSQVLTQDSYDDLDDVPRTRVSMSQDFLGIQHSLKIASNGVADMLGFVFHNKGNGDALRAVSDPNPADDEPLDHSFTDDTQDNSCLDFSLSKIPTMDDVVDMDKDDEQLMVPRNQNNEEATFETTVEASDGEYDSMDSDAEESQSYSDEEETYTSSECDSEFDEVVPVDSYLGSTGVPEEDTYWNDEGSRVILDPFLDPEVTMTEPAENDGDIYDDSNAVTIEMDQSTEVFQTESAMNKEMTAMKSSSSSPTGVVEMTSPPTTTRKPNNDSAAKKSPRNRVVKAISNTFRLVRRGGKLPSLAEEESQFNSQPSSSKRVASSTKATAESAPLGPVQVINLRDRALSVDSVSQITFPREEQRYNGDTEWWWGATVTGLEDTFYMAHAVADAANDFFTAKSIHQQTRENSSYYSVEFDDDDDDSSGALGVNDPTKLTDGEESKVDHLEAQLVKETKRHISMGPNLEMIALEVDNAKWMPPKGKSGSSVRGINGKAGSPQTKQQKLIMEKSLERLIAEHGYYHIEVAFALVALGKLLLEVGDSEPATERIVEALKIQKAIANPLEMTRSLHVLADIYSQQKEFNTALACYKDAQRLERRIYGPDRPENASTLNRMGRIYTNLGNFSMAMEKHQQALQVLQSCYGENLRHPAVSQTLILIGEVYYRERNSFNTIRSNADDYGNFIQAGMLDIISLAHEDHGSFKMALCFMEEKLQVVRDKKSPNSSVELVATLYSLGNLSTKAGIYWEAMSYYENALDMQKRQGCSDVDTSTANVLIGTVAGHLGHYTKALRHLNDALATLTLALGNDDELVADTLFRIGSIEAKLNDFNASRSHLNRALSIQEKRLGLNDPSTMRTQLEIGKISLGLFQVEKASEIFEGLKSRQENLYGLKHPDIADTLHHLGATYRLKGELDKAQSLFEQAYQMRQPFLGNDHPLQASSLHEIALLILKKDQVRKALSMCGSVLDVRRGALGERHLDVAVTISTLGRCQCVLGNFGASSKAFSEALPMAEEAVGANHAAVGDIYVDKAVLHLKQCEFNEAKGSVNKGLEIFKRAKVSEAHPRRVEALQLLEKIDRDEMLCV